jgi:hypothetical protein
MKTKPVLLLAAALLAACGSDLPTAAVAPEAPRASMYHWPTGQTPGFWFTFADPPAGEPQQPFDATLSPTVEVCRVTADTCGPVLATFTRASGSFGRLVTVDAQNQEYRVTWPTGSTGAAAGETWRISVRVGQRSLGFMDVKMVTSWAELFNTDTRDLYPWVAGFNFPVAFTIQRGIPGSVQASVSRVDVGVGDAVTVSATVRDLHGQPLPGLEPYWFVQTPLGAPGPVIAVDSGLVVGRMVGTATLWAWYGDAVPALLPVAVTDARREWSAMATPDGEGQRALWGSSAADVYAAGNAGVMRWNGAAWSYLDPVRWRSLYDVAGTSAASVWAVGDNGVMVHWDGAAWTGLVYDGAAVQPLPLGEFAPPARRITLRGAWAAAPSTVVAVGDSGTALVFDGTAWTVRATGTTAALTDVWGSSAASFYATTADGRILRFGAGTVAAVAGVQAPGALRAVWGSSAGNVYAVGDGGMVYRFDGAVWTRVRLPTRATLYAVWGSSAGEVYVAGAEGALYRFDGTRWTPEKRPGGSGQVFGVWGSAGTVYAAGAGGFIGRR